MILGIRPEDLEDAELEPDRDQRLEGEVELTEALGSEIMVHFSIDAPPAITDEVRELQEDAGTDGGLGTPTQEEGGRTIMVGRFGARSKRDQGRAGRRSPSTRALCISSIRTQVSVSTTEPKEREHRNDEATLHAARAARSRTRVPRRRLRRRRRRGRGHRRFDDRGRGGGGGLRQHQRSRGVDRRRGRIFPGRPRRFQGGESRRHGQLQVRLRAGDGSLDRGRGRQPAGHRGAAAARLHDRLRGAWRAEADRLRRGHDQGGLLRLLARPREGRRQALRPLLQGRQQVDGLVQRRRLRGRRRRATGRLGRIPRGRRHAEGIRRHAVLDRRRRRLDAHRPVREHLSPHGGTGEVRPADEARDPVDGRRR